MSLLTMIQAAANLIGVQQPVSVIGSTDTTTLQLLAFANQEGVDLAERAWPLLYRTATITTVASQQEYDLPADFNWQIVNTFWNAAERLPVWGPLTPQTWQAIEYGMVAGSPVGTRYVIWRGTSSNDAKVYLDPTPSTNGDTLAYMYVSSHWCASSGGTTQATWAADTDVGILDEDLMKDGIVWRFLRQKGLDYGDLRNDYERRRSRLLAQARPAPNLSLAGNRSWRLLGPQNLPETGYGA